MDRNDKTTNGRAGAILCAVCFALLAIVMVAAIFLGAARVFDGVQDLGFSLLEYSAHENAADQISSGIIIDKEIVNGHTSNEGGGIVAGSNGSGVIIGGNQEYIPTQYRLYVSGEYEIDGEVYEGEKYFDVPAEVYQAYKIGDFFDSKDFSPQTGASLCPSCGAACDTPYCGNCGVVAKMG